MPVTPGDLAKDVVNLQTSTAQLIAAVGLYGKGGDPGAIGLEIAVASEAVGLGKATSESTSLASQTSAGKAALSFFKFATTRRAHWPPTTRGQVGLPNSSSAVAPCPPKHGTMSPRSQACSARTALNPTSSKRSSHTRDGPTLRSLWLRTTPEMNS